MHLTVTSSCDFDWNRFLNQLLDENCNTRYKKNSPELLLGTRACRDFTLENIDLSIRGHCQTL